MHACVACVLEISKDVTLSALVDWSARKLIESAGGESEASQRKHGCVDAWIHGWQAPSSTSGLPALSSPSAAAHSPIVLVLAGRRVRRLPCLQEPSDSSLQAVLLLANHLGAPTSIAWGTLPFRDCGEMPW